MDSSTSHWTVLFPFYGVSALFFSIILYYRNPCTFVFNANSVDSDHMLHSVASDQDLDYLPMSLLWVARLKWVKQAKFNNEFLFRYKHQI